MRGDASRASAIQSLEKAGSSWFTARNALPNSGRSQHLDQRFCKQTNGTNPERPLGPTLEESRGFFRWLGLFKEQSHSTARAPPAVPFLCLLSVFFFWSQGIFSGRSIGFFLGRCFQENFAFQRVMGMLRDWP